MLFGTGTILAGDPSQRLSVRKKITNDEIQENIKTWKSQAEKIINFNKVQLKFNGDWLLKLNLSDIIFLHVNTDFIQTEKFR